MAAEMEVVEVLATAAVPMVAALMGAATVVLAAVTVRATDVHRAHPARGESEHLFSSVRRPVGCEQGML